MPGMAGHVVIVGGGVSGAAVALYLAQTQPPHGCRITVVEPREMLGAGLAYSTTEPAHRVNVAASRMSIYPEQPQHFAEWLERDGIAVADPEALSRTGEIFPRRSDFGRYVSDQIAPLQLAGLIAHERARVVSIKRGVAGWKVKTEAGRTLSADVVVVCTTHPLPAPPKHLSELACSDRMVCNPYDRARIGQVGPHENVMIVGSGLTSADIVATLSRRGHTGNITILSRHGLRSRGHARVCYPCEGDFISDPPRTALELLRRARAAVRLAESQGRTWHPVFEQLRKQGQSIWRGLCVKERTRLVKHLRTFWDAHRFRTAPQVEALLDKRIGEGSLRYVAGRIEAARETTGGMVIDWRPRGKQDIHRLEVDRVIVATGPAHREVITKNPALRELGIDGHLTLDSVGLGIATDAEGHALDKHGRSVEGLFVAGPLARGAVGELMGVAEVIAHARVVANEIAAAFAGQAAVHEPV